MATTTNYSWTTPDDTDLVKDGAAAIRTLGSSADTTVKNLNPGTTAGDIDYYTSGTAKARVAIGTAGQVLQVNSGATAPEWATPAAAGGMTLLSTTTLSGASVSITGIPATYKDLFFVVRNYLPTADTLLRFRFNADSAANRHHILSYAAGDNDATSFNSTSAYLSSGSNTSTSQSIIYAKIPDYTNTTTWKTFSGVGYTTGTTSTQYNARFYNALYNQTAAISSAEFFVSTGTMTSGTILLYGVN